MLIQQNLTPQEWLLAFLPDRSIAAILINQTADRWSVEVVVVVGFVAGFVVGFAVVVVAVVVAIRKEMFIHYCLIHIISIKSDPKKSVLLVRFHLSTVWEGIVCVYGRTKSAKSSTFSSVINNFSSCFA